jgi:fumarate hydratase class II
MRMRREHDSLGPVEVPEDRLWGAQTQRSLENFPIGRGRFVWGRPVIRAFGLLKKAAALANLRLGQLPEATAEAIARAADEVIAGQHDGEFPLVVFQTGSGTQSNMNANEVIARRATQIANGQIANGQIANGQIANGQITGGVRIHPNDDVNRSQSSNDAFPAVMHIASVEAIEGEAIEGGLLPAAAELCDALAERGRALSGIVLIGRTHLMDATPLTMGQLFSGWTAQLDQAMATIRASLDGLYELPLGGTAVGTGLNAPSGFGRLASELIAAETGLPFRQAENLFAVGSAHDAMVTASGALRTLAGALMKIANDIRWYASGPRAGIGELILPENEPGSSIMPGKVNPTQCEALTMVAVQVFGNDHAVAFAGSQGNFQLNAYKPVILHNLLESAELLAEACRSFTERCACGIAANEVRIAEHLEQSLMLVTALAPHIGYEKSAKIAQQAHRDGTSLRAAALKLGHVGEAEFDAWVRPKDMTHGT